MHQIEDLLGKSPNVSCFESHGQRSKVSLDSGVMKTCRICNAARHKHTILVFHIPSGLSWTPKPRQISVSEFGYQRKKGTSQSYTCSRSVFEESSALLS